MICPSCGHDNIRGADTCAECGMSVVQDSAEHEEGSLGVLADPLSSLQQRVPECIPLDAAMTDVLARLKGKNVGSLQVVDEAGKLVGIFTERDVMRALARAGAGILDEPVSKHMTERPHSIEPETGIDEAMEIMTEKRFRHLPVMTGTTLCGIVSIGDLVNFRIHQSEMEADALKQYIASG